MGAQTADQISPFGLNDIADSEKCIRKGRTFSDPAFSLFTLYRDLFPKELLPPVSCQPD